MKKNASNILDLLWNKNVCLFLSVNGFSERGSDYDRFVKLCRCAERSPNAPIVSWMQETVNMVLPYEVPICVQNAKEIWMRSAETFLAKELAFSVGGEKMQTFSLPCEKKCSDARMFVLNDLDISEKTWGAWKSRAWSMAQNAVQKGEIPTVFLSEGLLFQKCDLYRVERHLRSAEINADLWCTQLVYFLCEFCSENRLRGSIVCHADLTVFYQILQYVSKLTPLPALFLHCENQNMDVLLKIANTVMEKRENTESGTPPLLLMG